MRAAWCAMLLAVAVSAAPNPKSTTKSPPEEFRNSTASAKNFSCRNKCPTVVQCSCKSCDQGVCVFDGGLDCTRWCTCDCENEKKYGTP